MIGPSCQFSRSSRKLAILFAYGRSFAGILFELYRSAAIAAFLARVVMILAGWATFVDPVLRAAIACAACAEETSEAAEALFATSLQSLAVKDPDKADALWLVSVGAAVVGTAAAFAARGASTRADEIDTATETRRNLDFDK